MKAQIAVEYVMIVSIGLIIILIGSPYLFKTFTAYSDENRISLAKNTVHKIGESADMVFSQGQPAKMKIEVNIPEGIESVSFENKTILFKLKTSSGVNDVFYNTIPQLTGNLPIKSGNYYLSVAAYQDGVNISVV